MFTFSSLYYTSYNITNNHYFTIHVLFSNNILFNLDIEWNKNTCWPVDCVYKSRSSNVLIFRQMSAKLTLFKHNCITKCHIRLYGRHFHTVSYLANIHELLMNMKTQSTPETARESLRHVKYREKFQGNLPAPGIIDLHVVGSGGRGNPKCVMISTPYQR